MNILGFRFRFLNIILGLKEVRFLVSDWILVWVGGDWLGWI